MRNERFRMTTVVTAMALALSAQVAWADYAAGMDALAVKDHARARLEFEREPMNAQAVYQLARMAQLGLGEPRNLARRANLLQRSAELRLKHDRDGNDQRREGSAQEPVEGRQIEDVSRADHRHDEDRQPSD